MAIFHSIILSRRWDCTIHQVTSPAETCQRLGGQSVAVTNKVVIDRTVFLSAEAKELKLIAVAATGTDIIDREAAKEFGVGICNVPGYATQSVAQFTLALMLELSHPSRSLWRGRTFRRVAKKSHIHAARFFEHRTQREETRDYRLWQHWAGSSRHGARIRLRYTPCGPSWLR